MPIEIIKAPPPIAPIRNDVWVEYGCTAFRTGAAHLGGFMLARNFSPAAGHTFTFTLPDGTVLPFTAVSAAPDDSGTQYPRDSMAGLANALNGNPAFSALYTASLLPGTQQLWIAGRAPSTPLPAINGETGPYSTGDAQAAQDYAYAPNYSVRSRLWVEEEWMSNKWTLAGESDTWPDGDRHARENIAPLLQPERGYDWPAYGQALPMRSLAPQRRYRMQAWERYGQPAVDHAAATIDTRTAWFAGTRQRDTPAQPYWQYTLGNTDVPSPWLTYRGRTGRHEVSPAQQHVLGWWRNVVRSSGSLMRLRATVYYADGSQASTWTVSDAGMPWEKGEIALWPCGFNTLALYALQPALQPYKYTVQLFHSINGGAAAAASELHTFWLMEQEEGELHIEFVNSLGVVESVRCTGAWEAALALKYDSLYRQRRMTGGVIPPASGSNRRNQINSAQNTLKVCTGYADEGEHAAILDMMLSPELRLVDHAAKRQLPLLLDNGTHVVSRRGAGEDEHLYAINLQATVGDTEQAWGPRGTLPMPTAPAVGGNTDMPGPTGE